MNTLPEILIPVAILFGVAYVATLVSGTIVSLRKPAAAVEIWKLATRMGLALCGLLAAVAWLFRAGQ